MTDETVPALTLVVGLALACACHRLGSADRCWRWIRFFAILGLAGRVGQALMGAGAA